jgi:hypothetical protein
VNGLASSSKTKVVLWSESNTSPIDHDMNWPRLRAFEIEDLVVLNSEI